jgi:hypothetical protein
MTSQNPTENDPKRATTPSADAARKGEKPDKPLEIGRELTDDEMAAVAGGGGTGTKSGAGGGGG